MGKENLRSDSPLPENNKNINKKMSSNKLDAYLDPTGVQGKNLTYVQLEVAISH